MKVIKKLNDTHPLKIEPITLSIGDKVKFMDNRYQCVQIKGDGHYLLQRLGKRNKNKGAEIILDTMHIINTNSIKFGGGVGDFSVPLHGNMPCR